jgi:hypothetical protein
MVSRKKVRMYIPEEDLADLLGYWSKDRKIPVELEVTPTTSRPSPKEVVMGPDGEPIGSLLEVTREWLIEEGTSPKVKGKGLQVRGNPPIQINCEGTKTAKIEMEIDLDKESINWFKKLEEDELQSFMNDFSMVMSLKPFDFSIETASGIPKAILLSTKIYADGYSKDRLMSVLQDIRRSADLVATIMRGRTGRSVLHRSIDV